MNRGRLVSCTFLIAGVGAIAVIAQTPDASRISILEGVGLPAIELGALPDESHTPAAPETQRRAAMRAVLSTTNTGKTGAAYTRGRVIVKFRDQATTASRLDAVAEVSPTARIGERPSYADFDIVRIDPGEDAE